MPLEPVDLLIEARWVLPIAPVNTVLADHAVAVSDGRIVSLGPIAQMSARFEPRERVVRPDHALLPGFVNAHIHGAMTLLRELPVRGPRTRWLQQTVWPAEHRWLSPDFVREGTQLAMAEMLRAGITSFADMYWFPEEAARAASGARLRAAIGLPVADKPNVWADGATAHLAKAERLWDEYRSDPWVSLYFAPHDAGSISDHTLGRVQRIADELDARVAMALHEDATEIAESLALHGRRPLQRLQELGLLRPGFTGIHMNRLSEDDLDLIARTGLGVIACVQSDLRLAGGACPVRRLDIQHLAVGLGTGDPVSAGALDLLAEARAAALVAGGLTSCGALISDGEADRNVADAGVRGDSSGIGGGGVGTDTGRGGNGVGALPAADVLRMATLGGATALGLGSLTGSIEPGKAADLVCWNLGAPGAVFASQSDSRVPDSLVFGTTRQQATDVWTSGRAAVANGNLLAFDDQEMRTLAKQWALRVRTGDKI
jgi:5-methylthioadenosine/S-adenosylhomocysteine deaminase